MGNKGGVGVIKDCIFISIVIDIAVRISIAASLNKCVAINYWRTVKNPQGGMFTNQFWCCFVPSIVDLTGCWAILSCCLCFTLAELWMSGRDSCVCIEVHLVKLLNSAKKSSKETGELDSKD